jgi:hypothetical protein
MDNIDLITFDVLAEDIPINFKPKKVLKKDTILEKFCPTCMKKYSNQNESIHTRCFQEQCRIHNKLKSENIFDPSYNIVLKKYNNSRF